VTRAHFWRLMGWLPAIALMASCAPKPRVSVSSTAPAPALEAPAVPHPDRRFQGVSLTYYGDSMEASENAERALARRFEADTGIHVRIVPKPTNTSENFAAYERLFQSQSPDVDVLMLDVVWPGAFAPHLLDLRPSLGVEASGHLPALIRNSTVEGRLVAMPYYFDIGLLYYRTDLLKKYGFGTPPRTWDELESMARAIQTGERRTRRNFAGYVWQGNSYEGLTCNALEWQSSHRGGQVINPETGRVEVNTPGAIAAFRRAAGWVGTISPPGVTSYLEEDARNVFQSGNAAFMRNWPYAYAAAQASGSPIQGKVGVTALPRANDQTTPAAALGGWELAVSRYSRNPEAAIAFVRYLTCRDVLVWRARTLSLMPTMRSIFQDEELKKAQPMVGIMAPLVDYAVPRPSSRVGEHYHEVSSIYYQGVGEILQGGDPVETAGHMQEDIEQALKD